MEFEETKAVVLMPVGERSVATALEITNSSQWGLLLLQMVR